MHPTSLAMPACRILPSTRLLVVRLTLLRLMKRVMRVAISKMMIYRRVLQCTAMTVKRIAKSTTDPSRAATASDHAVVVATLALASKAASAKMRVTVARAATVVIWEFPSKRHFPLRARRTLQTDTPMGTNRFPVLWLLLASSPTRTARSASETKRYPYDTTMFTFDLEDWLLF